MGTTGKVLTPPPKTSGLVRVLWEENGMVLEHRLGREGQVDVKCIEPASGGSYFVDHLAILDVEMIKLDAVQDSDRDIDEGEVPEYDIISNEIVQNGFLDQYLHGLLTNRCKRTQMYFLNKILILFLNFSSRLFSFFSQI